MENVVAAWKTPDAIAWLELVDADGAFSHLAPELGLHVASQNELAWQSSDLGGSQACAAAARIGGQGPVACQLADLAPTGERVGIFELPKISLRTTDPSLQHPSHGAEGCVDGDPDVAQDQPEAREPEVGRGRHALRCLAHDMPHVVCAEESPERKEGQSHQPSERGQHPGQRALVSQVEEEILVRRHHVCKRGGAACAEEVRQAEADDASIAHEEPLVDGPRTSAE
mmetsp:Transcript_60695/g.133386  ORF Transcript_60695/g.133386 Transcript_60695/m.133386 type:complete len:227 (+) Transcript_60695:167-847(+)